MYPAFLKLTAGAVVLVGGGRVAAGKLDGLLAAGAQVTVVAPEIRPELEQPGVVAACAARSTTRDLDGAWYVVAAAPPDVNRQVLRGGRARQRVRQRRRRSAARDGVSRAASCGATA